jgi:hypothetical protein
MQKGFLNMHQSMNVASNAKMIEVLKAEFIGEAADVLRVALAPGGRSELVDTLGGAVLLAYVLARRCGISFDELDTDVLGKAETGINEGHKLESTYGDLSLLKKHFESGNFRGFGHDKKRRL